MKPSETPDTMETIHTNDATQQSPFEQRLHELLADYADMLPDGASVEARVRERLTAPHTATGGNRRRWRPARTGARGGQRRLGAGMRAALSIGLVAALLLGFAFVLRSHVALPQLNQAGSLSKNQCHMVTTAQGDTVCHLRNVKVTITVEQVYADATRTSIAVRISTPGLDIPHGDPVQYVQPFLFIIGNVYLQDAQGARYTLAYIPSNVAYASKDVAHGIVFLTPLPDTALNVRQTLTLVVPQFTLVDQNQLFSAVVDGPWQTSLQVTPHAGHTIALKVAPVTHHGITVQPVELDAAPNGNPFDGYGIGERLILKVSGLPANTVQGAIAGFTTQLNVPDGSAFNFKGTSTLVFAGRHPTVVDIPGLEPGATSPVGPSGTVFVEVIFLSPPLPTLTGAQTLSIDQFSLNYTQSPPIVKGPWVFHLALG